MNIESAGADVDKVSTFVDEHLTLQLNAESVDDSENVSVKCSEDDADTSLSTVRLDDDTSTQVVGSGHQSFCTAFDLSATIESLLHWSLVKYSSTRELIQEKLGHSNRTVDIELEEGVAGLREVQRRYLHILACLNSHITVVEQFIEAERNFSSSLTTLTQTEKDLEDNCKPHISFDILFLDDEKNKLFIATLKSVAESLNVLCQTTFEDTIETYRSYECARIEYDFHRHELEMLKVKSGANLEELANEQINVKVTQCRQKYERLRDAVQIKMKLLHDNKIKVLRQNLVCLARASTLYFSGCGVSEMKALLEVCSKNNK